MSPIPFTHARNRTIVQQAASIIAASNNDWQEARDLRQQIEDRDRLIANLKRQLTLALEKIAMLNTEVLTCAREKDTTAPV